MTQDLSSEVLPPYDFTSTGRAKTAKNIAMIMVSFHRACHVEQISECLNVVRLSTKMAERNELVT